MRRVGVPEEVVVPYEEAMALPGEEQETAEAAVPEEEPAVV